MGAIQKSSYFLAHVKTTVSEEVKLLLFTGALSTKKKSC